MTFLEKSFKIGQQEVRISVTVKKSISDEHQSENHFRATKLKITFSVENATILSKNNRF